MSVNTTQPWHQTAINAGQRTKRRQAERRHEKHVEATNKRQSAHYSGTYLGNPDHVVEASSSTMVRADVSSKPKPIPLVEATLAVGPLSVGMRVADPRRHYTHAKSVQADSIGDASESPVDASGEDSKGFGGPRSVTDGWSRRTQRRFFLTVKQLDLTLMENSPDPLAFIVFKFPKTTRTNRDLARTTLERLLAALKYEFRGDTPYPVIWNFEFHRDERVHFNLLLCFPDTAWEWLAKKWRTIAGHAPDCPDDDAIHLTRFAEYDDDGVMLSLADQVYNATAYMAGLGEGLSAVKAHQYKVPSDWSWLNQGSGRMWGTRGLGRAQVSKYQLRNVAQKEAIESYLRLFCPEKLTEYTDPKTGVVTVFNDGAFSETRRAGSHHCFMVTTEMHEHIVDLLERHDCPESPQEPAVLSVQHLAAVLGMTVEELMTGATEPLHSFA